VRQGRENPERRRLRQGGTERTGLLNTLNPFARKTSASHKARKSVSVEMMLEKPIKVTIFASRWLLAPSYLGLCLMLGVLMVKFIQELIHIIPSVFAAGES